jgi:exopolyphosphatase/guanosine-5'-triphosphate,3'-diphosphate pyrophosphatase
MIMDVGGGSSEFIFANKDEIIDLVSLNIGVSRIFQELELSDPFTNDDIDKVTQWLEERASTFLANKKCNVLVGASGCFETFYEMINRKSFPSVKNAIELPFDELMKNLEWIIGSDQIQRDLHPHIIPIRRKMAAIAAVKTNWIIEKLGVNKVIVSPCSLKEGVLQVAADF